MDNIKDESELFYHILDVIKKSDNETFELECAINNRFFILNKQEGSRYLLELSECKE